MPIPPPSDLLDPKNDYVFKRLFGESPALLVCLINDLRPDLPEIRSVEILNPGIHPELKRVRRLSADEEARRLAFVRERALRDEATLLKEAREAGLQQGLQQGHREGHREILLQLLHLRFGPLSEAVGARIAQADADSLLQWSARVLSAATAEEVVADGDGD